MPTAKEPCKDKCAPKGLRQTYWCGFNGKHTPKDHEEHDWLYEGQWYHCYG